MPTQEERLTTVEQKLVALQRETATNIREIDENITILLGVIRHQGQDTKRIFERLETIDDRLNTVEQHLNRLETRFDRLETKFDEHTALLTQILTRLPKTP